MFLIPGRSMSLLIILNSTPLPILVAGFYRPKELPAYLNVAGILPRVLMTPAV
jgi:hypothetical protein